MNVFISILSAIIIGVIIFYGCILFFMYMVVCGISYKNETCKSAWGYWEIMKTKRWGELSDEEKEKLISAYMVIEDDAGRIVTRNELIEMLSEQLPITEPNVGLSHRCVL